MKQGHIEIQGNSRKGEKKIQQCNVQTQGEKMRYEWM